MENEDVDAVPAVIEPDAGYVERVTGLPPGPAQRARRTPRRAARLAGPDVAHLGLLQVRGDRQGRGIGRRTRELLLDEVSSWPEIRTLRIAIVATNAPVAEPFRRSLGYVPNGEPKPYRYANLASTTQIFTREAR